jgi:hypothetical protein
LRNFYAMPDPAARAGKLPSPAHERRVLQIVTLAFWTPCCVADLWLMYQGGGGAAGFVFWLLFREAVVFLAFWFAAAAAGGMLRGSRAPKGPDARTRRKLRSRLAAGFKGYVAPSRGNRGQ